MYKLVVCDIDGTLVDSKGDVSDYTLKTIKKVEKKGVHVTLCTGRNIAKTLPIAKKLNLQIPFVCIDGIIIYDPVKNKIVKGLEISRKDAAELVGMAKEHDTFVEVSDGYKYYKFIPNEEFRKYDFFNGHDFKGRVKSWFNGIRYVKKPEDLLNINGPIYQVIIGSNVPVTKKITKEVLKKGYENIEVRDFLWEEYLFINYKGIGKAHGVQKLCDSFGISPSEVIAFGDEKNDLDMLQYVGLGIAMGNADESVKAVAKDVTLSNDDNGVAVALEKLILNKK